MKALNKLGSKGSNTTTTTSTPNPQAMGAYSGLLNQANALSQQTPVAPLQQTADLTPEQYQGISGINQYGYAAQPAIAQGIADVNQATAPGFLQAETNNLITPYLNQVVGSTEQQFQNQNAIGQNAVIGNAISQGALGGNRSAVAQAQYAGQVAPGQAQAIAGLENQAYTNALGTAVGQQQNLENAAYGLGNLGVSGQQAGLSGAGAQIQAGGLEQQTQQAMYNALYGQEEQQLGLPYQTLASLAGDVTGIGSQMGGTSTTTGPPPSLISQLAGLGAVGTGLFGSTGAVKGVQNAVAARGGGIKGYDDGGGISYDWSSLIPTANITRGAGPPKPPQIPQPGSGGGGGGGGLGNLSGIFGKPGEPSTGATPTAADDAAQDAAQDAADDAAGNSSGFLGGVGNSISNAWEGLSNAGAGAADALGEGASALAAGAGSLGSSIAEALPFLLLLHQGGRVRGYDSGGGIVSSPSYDGNISFTPYDGNIGGKTWIPSAKISRGSGIPKPPQIKDTSQQQAKDIQNLTQAIMGSNQQQPKQNLPTNIVPQGIQQFSPSPVGTVLPPMQQPSPQIGNAQGQFHSGGIVRHGYADGGMPGNIQPDPAGDYYSTDDVIQPGDRIQSGFDDGFTITDPRQIAMGPDKYRSIYRSSQEGFKAISDSGGEPVDLSKPDANGPAVPIDQPPAPVLPPPQNIPSPPDNNGVYVSNGIAPSNHVPADAMAYAQHSPEKPVGGIFSGIDLSANSKLWPALMAAGFGAMSSRSPFAGVAIGEGGLEGVKTYNSLSQQETATKLKQSEIDERAKQLSQQADQFHQKLAESSKERLLALQKPGVIDHDANDRPVYGYMDENRHYFTMDGKPYNPQNRAQAESEANLHGDDYIKTLPPGDQAQVRQAGQYMATIPSANSRAPDAQRLRREIFQAYPELDERMYGLQAGAARKFWSGTDGDTIKSWNVSISHLDTLQKAANALQNGQIPLFNSLKNMYEQQTGQSLPTDFNAVRDIVADEIVKGIVGSRPALGDRQEAKHRIDQDFSQGQFDSVINKYKELMTGQLMGSKQKFVASTGLPPEVFDRFLAPETKQQLMRHEGSGNTSVAPTPVGPPIIQNGNRFQKNSDGTTTYLGPAVKQ